MYYWQNWVTRDRIEVALEWNECGIGLSAVLNATWNGIVGLSSVGQRHEGWRSDAGNGKGPRKKYQKEVPGSETRNKYQEGLPGTSTRKTCMESSHL